MGSRLFSNTTNLLGGRDFSNADHRRAVADVLDIDVARIPDQPSWAYDQIVEGILKGKIKGLWVVCTNPAHSWINQNTCRDILDRLDFLVVQDMFHTTETAQAADLVLPAAGWGEKDGTLINSERRIGLIKKVSRAPGQALADFSIFRLVAQAWGCADMFAKWQTPEDVFQSMKALSSGQPCDFSRITDYRMIDQRQGIQWPYSGEVPDETPQRRLFSDGRFYHPDGRAKFLFEEPRQMPEPPSSAYPYLLLTGRGTASQWHTQTRTSKSQVLRRLYPEQPYVELHPEDAIRENIRPNQWVRVESQRGSATVRALVTPTVQTGQLFMSMHYEVTNRLTLAHFDPYSRQPSYKNCAVSITPIGTDNPPDSL
jgi:assimilatory nitrate reductase catalytic subunit